MRKQFVARFAVYAILFFTVVLVLTDEDLRPLLVGYSVASAAFLQVLGFSVERIGTVLSLGGFSVNVAGQCSALFEVGLLVAATLAYPAAPGQRFRGILFGTGALLLVNLLRIASLLLIGSVDADWFKWAHLYVCQGLLVACVAAIWLFWIGRLHEVRAT